MRTRRSAALERAAEEAAKKRDEEEKKKEREKEAEINMETNEDDVSRLVSIAWVYMR